MVSEARDVGVEVVGGGEGERGVWVEMRRGVPLGFGAWRLVLDAWCFWGFVVGVWNNGVHRMVGCMVK